MKKRWLILSVMLGLSLLIGACAPMMATEAAEYEMPASEPQDRAYEETFVGGVNEESDYAAMPEEEKESGAGTASAVERMVIYNADMSIAVEDPAGVMETIIDMAEEAGGFVVSSNLSKTYSNSGVTLPRANLMVRVPAGDLDSILAEIRDLTPDPAEDVIYENVSGQDVTAEYTDLGSRLSNLEAAEEALAALMEEAKDPEDVLAIFDELTYYRGEIEIVKGRMQYLEESAALSAISIEIVAKESLQPIEIGGWKPEGTVKDAVETLINTLQFLADAAIWFGIYCLPFLIPLGVGVYFLVKALKKRRKQKKAKKAEVIAQTKKQEEPEKEG